MVPCTVLNHELFPCIMLLLCSKNVLLCFKNALLCQHMLLCFQSLLCSKLCQQNSPRPTRHPIHPPGSAPDCKHVFACNILCITNLNFDDLNVAALAALALPWNHHLITFKSPFNELRTDILHIARLVLNTLQVTYQIISDTRQRFCVVSHSTWNHLL